MNNLWNIKHIDEVNNPISMLEEQSKLLLKSTNNKVGAIVTKSNSTTGSFIIKFELTSPSMPNYSFRVLSIFCSPILYPIKIKCDENIADELELDEKQKINGVYCNDYDEFSQYLAKILGSDYISKVIASIQIMVTSKLTF